VTVRPCSPSPSEVEGSKVEPSEGMVGRFFSEPLDYYAAGAANQGKCFNTKTSESLEERNTNEKLAEENNKESLLLLRQVAVFSFYGSRSDCTSPFAV
jgi:hypothetical protein